MKRNVGVYERDVRVVLAIEELRDERTARLGQIRDVCDGRYGQARCGRRLFDALQGPDDTEKVSLVYRSRVARRGHHDVCPCWLTFRRWCCCGELATGEYEQHSYYDQHTWRHRARRRRRGRNIRERRENEK